MNSGAGSSLESEGGLEHISPGRPRSSDKFKSSQKIRRLVLLSIGGLVGLGLLVLVLIWLQRTLQGLSAPPLKGDQPQVSLANPPVTIPEPGGQMMAPDGPLTKETAQQAIQSWLTAKSLAFGSDHQIERLEQILAEPALSRSRQSAEADKQKNSYWQYKHAVEVNSVETSPASPDRAKVDAAVKESAQFYREGQENKAKSYNENLRVQYDLVRQDGRWLIKDWTVVR